MESEEELAFHVVVLALQSAECRKDAERVQICTGTP